MTFSIIRTEAPGRGVVTTARNNEQTGVAMLSDLIPNDAKSHATAISNGLISFGSEAERINRDMTPAGREQHFRDNLGFLQPHFRACIEVGIVETQKNSRRYNELDALPELSATDPLKMQIFNTLSFADKIEFVQKASASQLAPIIATGPEMTFPGADPQIFDGVVKRHRRLALIQKLGAQGRFAGTPTADDPFAAAKPDLQKAEDFADQCLKTYAREAEAVDNLGVYLGNVCVIVAILANVQVNRAHAFLSGEESLA